MLLTSGWLRNNEKVAGWELLHHFGRADWAMISVQSTFHILFFCFMRNSSYLTPYLFCHCSQNGLYILKQFSWFQKHLFIVTHLENKFISLLVMLIFFLSALHFVLMVVYILLLIKSSLCVIYIWLVNFFYFLCFANIFLGLFAFCFYSRCSIV